MNQDGFQVLKDRNYWRCFSEILIGGLDLQRLIISVSPDSEHPKPQNDFVGGEEIIVEYEQR